MVVGGKIWKGVEKKEYNVKEKGKKRIYNKRAKKCKRGVNIKAERVPDNHSGELIPMSLMNDIVLILILDPPNIGLKRAESDIMLDIGLNFFCDLQHLNF
jgi:hypothetical protein